VAYLVYLKHHLYSRLRFSRLSRIRKLLGGKPDEIEVPADASKYVEDDDYLIVDFSLSWVSPIE
jgi:hypothetical protein